ncbi:serine protease [Thermus scotoductus]|uniref:Serine protease n=1 Tax=Thermus scotoductus TaxID=37636 RepID=A0A430S8D0_THESC|nr:S8 family serine peptidase [Thermus scotoductus]RTG92391.1 serine protease [Thermus scotoductus]RTH05929.1 serine protease [Thermus scotoductus]RTH08632.1 serine protease [Thermus scotoductus]RTH10712.1 serine protease [Thermus scotoductus]RTH16046.1 serine protease [Thermus scotoductus]
MRKGIYGLLGILALLFAACTGQTPSAQTLSIQMVPGKPNPERYLVVFRSETLPPGAKGLAESAGAKVLKELGPIGAMTVLADGETAARLAKRPEVLAVGKEHLYRLPERVMVPEETYGAPTAADSLYRYQWDIRRIGAHKVWERVPLSVQAGATVAVLDTGVMDNHPDLATQIVAFQATNYCRETGGPNNTPSYPKYTLWIDFDHLDPNNLCTPAPSVLYEAHGTHVSGTVAAAFGGGRVVGVAPGVRLAAYKVFDRYHYTDPETGEEYDDVGAWDGPIFEAILDAASKGYSVINMSLGGILYTQNRDDVAAMVAWDRVMKYANRMGTLIVASAGNSAQNANGPVVHIPSDLPTVVSVSATGTATPFWQQPYPTSQTLNAEPGQDILAFYSNYGAAVDLSAPGGDCGLDENGQSWCTRPRAERPAGYRYHLILSTVIVDENTPAYAWYAGTSMASPHVAAVAALVRALHPEWGPGEVRAHLKATAENIGSRQLFGHGLVNADQAVR